MGGAQSILITTDNKRVDLSSSQNIGQCSGDKATKSCNYTSGDLQNLLNKSGSGTKKFKQIITGPSNAAVIYDQDNFTGNRYSIPPNSTVIIPPCFAVKSVKQQLFIMNGKVVPNPSAIGTTVEEFRVNDNLDIDNQNLMFGLLFISLCVFIYYKYNNKRQ